MKYCNECHSEFSETYHNELYCASCKKERRHNGNIKKYGINSKQYKALFLEQGGVCCICRSENKKRLAVDHCHKTGVVRGLLCSKCNTGLGCFEECRILLSQAVKYLAKADSLSGYA